MPVFGRSGLRASVRGMDDLFEGTGGLLQGLPQPTPLDAPNEIGRRCIELKRAGVFVHDGTSFGVRPIPARWACSCTRSEPSCSIQTDPLPPAELGLLIGALQRRSRG